MYWVLILALLFLGWRLSQPELSQWLLLLQRKKHWLGTLKPNFKGVHLYEDPRDLTQFNTYLQNHERLKDHLQLLAQQSANLAQKKMPVIDTRLCLAAQLYAEAMSRGKRISQGQVIRFVSSYVGVCTPIPWVVYLTTSIEESEAWIIDRFNQNLYEALQHPSPLMHLGIAQVNLNDHEKVTVLLMQPIYTILRPVSRYLEGDMGLSIHGEAIEYMPLTLWITPPHGKPYRADLQQEGVHFSFQLNDRARGIYQIELMIESSQGPVVCLNYPIYRSVKPPSELVLTSIEIASRFAWINRRHLTQLIYQTRHRENLPVLKKHRSLSQIAQRYAQEMANHNFVAHTSPQGERLHHRLDSLSLENEKVLENLSVGMNMSEMHDRLLCSPAHLAAILDEDVTHLGVGVSRKGDLFYGVQLFSLLNRRLNVSIDKIQVQRMLQSQRKKQGLGRLPLLHELEETAGKVARALVVGQCRSHEVLQHASHLLLKEHQQSYTIDTLVLQVNSISQFPQREAWLLNQVKGFGIGLAQGRSDEPIWIVLILRIQSKIPTLLLQSDS
jgi:hypothetical protein